MQSESLKGNGKLSRLELVVLIMSATVTITLVSASSPLYPFNPWDDANCFFTLGRGIIHGYVPYRDLYEQKGPLLYFIYALAALISEKSFIGSWIAECISASLFAVFSWKTTKLFIDPSKYAIAVMPLFLGLVYTTGMFNFGGNAEELCFPLLTVALYFGFKAIVKSDGLPTNKEAMLIGLFTGIVFWIKYTLHHLHPGPYDQAQELYEAMVSGLEIRRGNPCHQYPYTDLFRCEQCTRGPLGSIFL